MNDLSIGEEGTLINTSYEFVVKSEVHNGRLIHSMKKDSALYSVEKAVVTLDDNVNVDDYSIELNGESLRSKAYIILDKEYLKIFQKPFLVDDIYYEISDSSIVISNTVRAFGRKRIEKNSAYLFVENGILPPGITILQGVKRLEPGEIIKVQVVNNPLQMSKKWLVPLWFEYIEQNSREIVKRGNLRNLLKGAIEKSLEAKKPRKLSVLLSGGLDSGILAFELGEHKGIDDKLALTAWYDTDLGRNELEVAGIRSQKFGFSHRPVLFGPESFKEALDEAFNLIDYPITDPPAVLERFLVGESLKDSSDYVFSGELADTLFGGGNTFTFERYVKWLRIVSRAMMSRSPNESYTRKIVAALSAGSAFDRQMKIWIKSQDSQAYSGYTQLGERIADRLRLVSSFQLFTIRTQIDHSKIHLAKRERSVFYSVPFENMKVAEFALALPARLKVHNLRNKYLLRHSYSRYLPGKKKKQSYSPPVYRWLDEKYLREGVFPFNDDPIKYGERGPEFGARIWRNYCLNRWFQDKAGLVELLE